MRWRWLRRLFFEAPEDRWDGDFLVLALAIGLGTWLGRSRDSVGLGIAVTLMVLALERLVFYLVVKRRR